MLETLLHILRGPTVSIFMLVCVAAFAFTFAMRRHDANAPIMCATIIALWFAEIVAKASMGEAFRSVLPLSDLIAAAVAYRLGLNRPSEWIRVAYTTLIASCAVHVFYQWGEGSAVMSARQYITLLNLLFLVRLACFLTPGVSHVGKTLGAVLFRVGHQPALVLEASQRDVKR